MAKQITFESAKLDPTAVFQSPEEILDLKWSDQQKIDILNRWRYDIMELAVAAEENMSGIEDTTELLERVIACLHQLGVSLSSDDSPPTKHGMDDLDHR